MTPGSNGAKELIRLDIPAQPAFVGVARFGAPVRPREANVGRASGAIDGGDAVYLRGLYAEDLAEFARASGLDVSGWLRSPGGAATGAGSSTAARS